MKIVIIENELYLAQSIASKLGQKGFETEIFSSISEASNSNADVYLLSTTIPGQNPLKFIEKHKNKVIILIVNYINNDTVVKPLEVGAKDYIVKPFIIDELLRKINHYLKYKTLEEENNFYKDLINNIINEIDVEFDLNNLNLPITIYTNFQRVADKFAIEMSKKYKMSLIYINLEEGNWQSKLKISKRKKIYYITKLEKLKKEDHEKLYELLEDEIFILSSLDSSINTPFEKITLNSNNKMYDQNNILTINEYVQYIIKKFQYQYPDTELSKKLGISRKSLWEKRRKFELFKKKQ